MKLTSIRRDRNVRHRSYANYRFGDSLRFRSVFRSRRVEVSVPDCAVFSFVSCVVLTVLACPSLKVVVIMRRPVVKVAETTGAGRRGWKLIVVPEDRRQVLAHDRISRKRPRFWRVRVIKTRLPLYVSGLFCNASAGCCPRVRVPGEAAMPPSPRRTVSITQYRVRWVPIVTGAPGPTATCCGAESNITFQVAGAPARPVLRVINGTPCARTQVRQSGTIPDGCQISGAGVRAPAKGVGKCGDP